MTELYRLRPFVRHTPWGGNVLATDFAISCADGAVGEILDASCLDNMPSTIAGGAEDGCPLTEIFRREAPQLLGPDYERLRGAFPFLVKRIDAGDDLSVQVHPDDADAMRLEKKSSGKSEAWVVLDAKPGATLLLGLEEGTTCEDVKRALIERRIHQLMRRITVKPGDVLPVPAGCVHSIGKDIVVFEAQQSVDLTYRLYDWDRPDKDGKLRTLHIEPGLECIKPDLRPTKLTPELIETSDEMRVHRLVRMPQFEIRKWEARGRSTRTIDRLHALHVLRGRASLRVDGGQETFALERGDTLLVPAISKKIAIDARDGCDLFAVTPVDGVR